MIVCVLNQKGGCGKTTIALNLASYWSDLIHNLNFNKVTLVDTDHQRSLTDWHAAGESGLELVAADRVSMLERLMPDPDTIYIIDGASKADDMCIASIKLADIVIVPIKPSPMDQWSVTPIMRMLYERQQLADGVPTAAFVISMTAANSTLDKDMRQKFDQCEEQFNLLHASTADRVIYKKSAMIGNSVFDSNPRYTQSERTSLAKAQGEIQSIALEVSHLANKTMQQPIQKEVENNEIKLHAVPTSV